MYKLNKLCTYNYAYPNGESYVVLSKKTMKGYLPGTPTCYFWMTEEELLRMSAAIVDAGLYSGSTLFLTKYIEPNIQEASVVNYIPSLSVLSLLEDDPNILESTVQELSWEVRKELENRLADSLSSDVSVISWDLDPNNPDRSEEQQTRQEDPVSTENNGELGDIQGEDDYFYYVEEDEAKEEDIEYGE